MKTVKRAVAFAAAVIVAASVLGGCGARAQSEPVPFRTVSPDITEIKAQNTASGLEMPPAVNTLSTDRAELFLETGAAAELVIQVEPEDAWNKDVNITSGNEAVAVVDGDGRIKAVSPGYCVITVSSAEMPQVSTEIKVTVSAPVEVLPLRETENTDGQPDDEGQNSTVSQPTYINGILIANKTYGLPADYNPGVDATAYGALMQMFADAANEGITLWVASGFRSYSWQNTIYNNYVAMDGKANADRYSARAGHSEHQTGLAFDLNYLTQEFGQSREGLWLAENCHKYGFIIRYPQGKEHITGYMYEPWHIRYLGVDTASSVYESGLCLEEYLGITSVYAEG